MSSSTSNDFDFFKKYSKQSDWTSTAPGASLIEGLGEPLEYGPHEALLSQGELPTSVGLIRSGIVKMAFADASGRETILGLRSSGWWAGCTAVVLDIPSLYNVVTLSACLVSIISKEDFFKGLENDPDLVKAFLLSQSRELLLLQQLSITQGSELTRRLQLVWNN